MSALTTMRRKARRHGVRITKERGREAFWLTRNRDNVGVNASAWTEALLREYIAKL